MSSMFANVWTTALGVLAGMIAYLINVGPALPTTSKDWGSLLFAALLAGIGVVAKDATTGSKPK